MSIRPTPLVGIGYTSLLERMCACLLADWPARPGERLVAGSSRPCCAFPHMATLGTGTGLTTAEAVAMMTALAQQAAAGQPEPPAPG
jgi:hypothetical protein